jgi:hypothetical protein
MDDIKRFGESVRQDRENFVAAVVAAGSTLLSESRSLPELEGGAAFEIEPATLEDSAARFACAAEPLFAAVRERRPLTAQDRAAVGSDTHAAQVGEVRQDHRPRGFGGPVVTRSCHRDGVPPGCARRAPGDLGANLTLLTGYREPPTSKVSPTTRGISSSILDAEEEADPGRTS